MALINFKKISSTYPRDDQKMLRGEIRLCIDHLLTGNETAQDIERLKITVKHRLAYHLAMEICGIHEEETVNEIKPPPTSASGRHKDNRP